MYLPVIYQLITMVLLMAVGFVMRKKNILTAEGVGGVSAVLTKVAVPAMLIYLLQRDFSFELLSQFGLACLASFLATIGSLIVFLILGVFLKMDFPKLGLFAGCGAYCNVAFMGQPLVEATFGADGLIYCVATIFIQNVAYSLIISAVMSHKCGEPKSASQVIKDILLNPICIGAFLGFAFFALSIRLPSPLLEALNAAKVTTTCLSMIIIGSLLASSNIKAVLSDKVVYVFSFFCIALKPILTKLAFAPFFGEGLLLSVVVLLTGTPAAAALPALAKDCKNDDLRASEYVFVSTVFSVITLPLVANFLC